MSKENEFIDLVTFGEKFIGMANSVKDVQEKSTVNQCARTARTLRGKGAETIKAACDDIIVNNQYRLQSSVLLSVYNFANTEMKIFEGSFGEEILNKLCFLFREKIMSETISETEKAYYKSLLHDIMEATDSEMFSYNLEVDPNGLTSFNSIISLIVCTPALELVIKEVGMDGMKDSMEYQNLFDRFIMTYYSYLIGKWKVMIVNTLGKNGIIGVDAEISNDFFFESLKIIEETANAYIPTLEKVFGGICCLALTARFTDQSEFSKDIRNKVDLLVDPAKQVAEVAEKMADPSFQDQVEKAVKRAFISQK